MPCIPRRDCKEGSYAGARCSDDYGDGHRRPYSQDRTCAAAQPLGANRIHAYVHTVVVVLQCMPMHALPSRLQRLISWSTVISWQAANAAAGYAARITAVTTAANSGPEAYDHHATKPSVSSEE